MEYVNLQAKMPKDLYTQEGYKTKPNAPVSPTGQQAVDNTPTQAIEDDSIKTKHIKQPKKANRTINEDKDDLLAAIAKLDGLNLADAKSQGIDVEAYKGKRAAGLLGIFKQDGTGSDFDTMAEYLSGYGYPVHEGGNTAWDNVNGKYSVNALADALIGALNGGVLALPAICKINCKHRWRQTKKKPKKWSVCLMAKALALGTKQTH